VRIPIGPGAVHVERYGFGDRPVVMIHGFGTSGFLWRGVAPALPLGRVTAFAVDLFGWGESDLALDADYGIGAQADYLDRVLTVLRIAQADVVAIDLGCAVALSLAVRRPARVRSMVLINPGDPDALRGDEFGELQRLAARHLLEASRGVLGAAILLGPILEKSVAKPESMPPALVGRYSAPFVGRDGVRHLMQLERAVNDQALSDVAWEKIAAPVLVVRGEKDSWVAPDVSATIASRLPNAEHRRMAEAARLVPEDSPAALAELLGEWIGPEARAGRTQAHP
jgi:pimeloyl-ACP methyl ester carboxylesterase